MNLKQFIKNKISSHNFDVNVESNTLIFKLNNSVPFSDNKLIVKHRETGKRISRKIKNSKAEIGINDIISISELGYFDIYLEFNIGGKRFLTRSPFKKGNENRRIVSEKDKLILKSANKNSSLTFELRSLVDDSHIDITEVYGEDISEIIYNKPSSQEKYDYNVSAVVLVYNGGDFLRDCIESLVNQTLEGLEIILINDNSTDDSLEVCREFAAGHDNIRIIDKKENHGLATSANMGIKIAKGEYVILVDNDDIVPPDAYEKLFRKAKQTGADISIGQANLLYGDRQNEMYNVERKVLEDEMVIDNICEFPQLFNDAFYWNKIIKKSFLIENAIYLPKGMIYADRKFSHMAYVHAGKISVIPDCVYIWRIRIQKKDEKSLSRRRHESWNYINRIDSYEQDLDKIIDAYPDYFRILMRRVFTPVRGISDEAFREVFFKRGVGLLKRECGKLDNIYDNGFDNWDNLVLYLLLNDYTDELDQLLALNIDFERDIVDIDDKSYWRLFLFEKDNVPDELFEIKSMMPQFLNIAKISLYDDYILFDGIRLPKNLKTEKCEINFAGKTDYDGVLKDNTLSYEIIPKNSAENVFTLKVPTADLADFEVYNIFFKAYYEDRLSDSFRVKKECIESINEDSENMFVAITNYGNVSIISQDLNEKFMVNADDKQVKITLKNSSSFKQKTELFIQNDSTGEKTFFSKVSENEYALEWKYFADDNTLYSFYIRAFDIHSSKRNVKLNLSNLLGFKEIKKNDKNIFLDDKNNLKLMNN